ncbi:MAG: hypothetical protein H7Y12_14665 [Sphingobacteriaceae bacterium]|nr:hypothetical protein [Cytophagaceae bacterium]
MPDSVVLPYRRHLRNPFFLKLFVQLLDANEGQAVEVGSGGEGLMAQYYTHLTTGEYGVHVKTYLHELGRRMVEDRHAPALVLAEAIAAGEVQNQHARLKEITQYQDPLRHLISEGVLYVSEQRESGRVVEQTLRFTYQRLHELTLATYLRETYGEPSGPVLETLIDHPAEFEEYTNALALLARRLWQQDRYAELCQLRVRDGYERYHSLVLGRAIVSELAEYLGTQPGLEARYQRELEFYRKTSALVQEVANLRAMPTPAQLWLWGPQQRFHDKSGAVAFLKPAFVWPLPASRRRGKLRTITPLA